ncbi:MAG: hypothetical protein LQ338_004582 [Usnochroma carphineum]|nr:MAG: hypothetical protein LQ338_004582 [Usnochroma carphineum]
MSRLALFTPREDVIPKPQTAAHEIALYTVMEKEYPPVNPAAMRRMYEINMNLLYRLYHHKTFHKLIPEEKNERTQESYTRLLDFVHMMPEAWERRREAGRLFRVRKEGYLTDLAQYWRSLPDKEQMMKYKDIWEHVAQRPLAWEGLV